MPAATLAEGAPALSRKRTQTRERLLAAALDVFAEQGVGGASVEQICDRAGFTRGAFYSNYSSKEELLLALYARQSGRLVSALADALAERGPTVRPGPDLGRVVVELLQSVPQDRRWFLVNSELVLHAVRHPQVGAALVEQRALVRRGVEEVLRDALAHLGLRTTVDLPELVRWLVALHEGGLAQAYLEPDVLAPESLALSAAPVLLAAVTQPRTPPRRSRRPSSKERS